jgi:hypothetical protein
MKQINHVSQQRSPTSVTARSLCHDIQSFIIFIPSVFLSSIFRRVRKIEESDYELLRVCPSVCMEQLDGISWNMTFEYFSKIYRENSIFIETWHE